jgi:hypothetical protein
MVTATAPAILACCRAADPDATIPSCRLRLINHAPASPA